MLSTLSCAVVWCAVVCGRSTRHVALDSMPLLGARCAEHAVLCAALCCVSAVIGVEVKRALMQHRQLP